MPKKEDGSKVLYIKVASLADLCRYASNFDFTSENLICTKHGSGYMLVAFGEALGKAVIGYYVETKSRARLLRYNFANGEKESVQEVDRVDMQGKSYIGVVNMDISQLKEDRKINAKDIMMIKAESPEDIMKLVAEKSVKMSSMPHAYAFAYKGKQVLCAIAPLHHNFDRRAIYYTLVDGKADFSFARYNYNEGKLEFTSTVGEHSYMYAKIINLAEPFPFFKP